MKSDLLTGEKKIDMLMHRALGPDMEPDEAVKEALRRKLDARQEGDFEESAEGASNFVVYRMRNANGRKSKDRRTTDMKKTTKRKISAAVIAAAGVLTLSVTGAAASKYLSREEVVEQMGKEDAAQAFETGNVLEVNQTQESGDYLFTLYGIASKEKLAESGLEEAAGEGEGKFYAVLAIERKDGTPMPAISDDGYRDEQFFVSPLIQGLEPWKYNIFSMDGSYGEMEKDGVLYRVMKCDDIAFFADRKLYLCVNDSMFYQTDAFRYNETDGTIRCNEEYEGIQALFDLPIDSIYANEEKAEEFLGMFDKADNLSASEKTGSSGALESADAQKEILPKEDGAGQAEDDIGGYGSRTEVSACPVIEKILKAEWEKGSTAEKIQDIPVDTLLSYASLVEESVQTLAVKDGMAEYAYRGDNGGGWSMSCTMEYLDYLFDECADESGLVLYGTNGSGGADGQHRLRFQVLKREDDGTVKGMIYVAEEAEF